MGGARCRDSGLQDFGEHLRVGGEVGPSRGSGAAPRSPCPNSRAVLGRWWEAGWRARASRCEPWNSEPSWGGGGRAGVSAPLRQGRGVRVPPRFLTSGLLLVASRCGGLLLQRGPLEGLPGTPSPLGAREHSPQAQGGSVPPPPPTWWLRREGARQLGEGGLCLPDSPVETAGVGGGPPSEHCGPAAFPTSRPLPLGSQCRPVSPPLPQAVGLEEGALESVKVTAFSLRDPGFPGFLQLSSWKFNPGGGG